MCIHMHVHMHMEMEKEKEVKPTRTRLRRRRRCFPLGFFWAVWFPFLLGIGQHLYGGGVFGGEVSALPGFYDSV